MKKFNRYYLLFLISPLLCVVSCNKKDTSQQPDPVPSALVLTNARLGNNVAVLTGINYNTSQSVAIRLSFNNALDRSTVSPSVSVKENGSTAVPMNFAYANNDSTLIITPSTPLKSLARYFINATISLQSVKKGNLNTPISIEFYTQIDSTDKFPVITDNALLDLVQQQTFKYFWDFGHPVSGLARERNSSGETVTSGGSGFGIMAMVTAVSRNFKTRAEVLARLQTIVGFLKNTAQKFHGAFPHWLNGSTGMVIPFSPKDNGADLVETAFLIQGLLTARQFFNGSDAAETALRNDINSIWQGVEWSWFRQNNQNVLYWHWSPNFGWDMNVQVRGWNEAMIVYVLAASSPGFAVPKIVYDNGWAINGAIRNNNSFYGYQLPLGPNLGGHFFFEHYSFLGINPFGLNDQYASYQLQAINHTKINYEYSKANPRNYFGYSNLNWGLTASDIQGGYTASSPTNDVGVIAPTAAISSIPYTPIESLQALKFFYYKLGDKLWGEYGFKDAFNLHTLWFADSYLAIDQGPIIIMIENYRSGLLWNLFTSCPEVKAGMLGLGFTAPYL